MSGHGGDHGPALIEGRAWPTGMIERPGPREAWRALLDADAAVRGATPEEYEAAELAAQEARAVFTAALERAGA